MRHKKIFLSTTIHKLHETQVLSLHNQDDPFSEKQQYARTGDMKIYKKRDSFTGILKDFNKMLLLEWLMWRMSCMSVISAMMEFLHTPSNLMTRWDFGLVICCIQKQVYLTLHFSFQVRKTWMNCPMIFSFCLDIKRAKTIHYCVAVGEYEKHLDR